MFKRILHFTLVISLVHSQWALARPDDCDMHPSIQDAAAAIAGNAAVSCEGEGTSATAQEKAALLNGIRDDASARNQELMRTDLTGLQIAESIEEVKQMRTLLALRQVELSASRNSLEKIADGTGKTEVLMADKLFYAQNFNSQPDPLTPAEMERARKAIAIEMAEVDRDLRTTVAREKAEIEAMGMNALVPVSTMVGDRLKEVQARIRLNASVGYDSVASKHPYNMFITKAEPTPQDVREAYDKYRKKISDEIAWTKSLRTSHPPDEAAYSFLFYTSSVNEVIGKNPKLCGAFNALMEELRAKEKFRNAMALTVGLGAAGVCIAAAFFTAGIAGAACLALSAAEFGVSADGALANFRKARALYPGVLQGGDAEEYEKAQNAAKGYLLAAGFSAVGIAAGALEVAGAFATAARAQGPVDDAAELAAKAADSAIGPASATDAPLAPNAAGTIAQNVEEAFPAVLPDRWVTPPGYVTDLGPTGSSFAKGVGRFDINVASVLDDAPVAMQDRLAYGLRELDQHQFTTKVAKVEDIPWAKDAGYVVGDRAYTMGSRLSRQPQEIQDAVLGVYNRMHDKEAFGRYMAKLTDDTVAEIRARGIPAELAALQNGTLNRNAVLRVLVKRSKARGDGPFSTVVDAQGALSRGRKPMTNEGFREAVGQGPFFDKPNEVVRHGVDMHLLQRDYVSDVVGEATNGKPQTFWNFLGSKQGINYWVPLFDAVQGRSTLGSPEVLHHHVIKFMPLL